MPARTEGWAAAIRAAYVLDATETELVNLAETALTLARDPEARHETRLAAMGRFQRLVQQLDLEVPDGGEAETETTRTRGAWPRQVG